MKNKASHEPSDKATTAGLLNANPVLIMLLGLCPALAVSDTVIKGLGIGIATCIVLVLSSTVISLLRSILPKQNRVACIALVIALLVSVIDLVMHIMQPQLHASLGIFVPLIAVNCLLYQRAIQIAAQSTAVHSVKDALFTGAGFITALILISAVREILGSGTLLGHVVLGSGFQQQPVTYMALPAGAFLVFAFLKMGFNKCRRNDLP